jgi:hypothetical protein
LTNSVNHVVWNQLVLSGCPCNSTEQLSPDLNVANSWPHKAINFKKQLGDVAVAFEKKSLAQQWLIFFIPHQARQQPVF